MVWMIVCTSASVGGETVSSWSAGGSVIFPLGNSSIGPLIVCVCMCVCVYKYVATSTCCRGSVGVADLGPGSRPL